MTKTNLSSFCRSLTSAAATLLFVLFTALPALADGSILIYHRFGEDRYPSTNVRLDQLDAQIAYIKRAGLVPVSLDRLADARNGGAPLPDKAIVVTVDDAYRSFMTEGWPRFKAAGIPVALFVATDPVDGATALGNYLTWDNIRQLRDEGVTIGHHGAAHIHMPSQGVDAARADIARASQRFMEELGVVPAYFAYPYGEYSSAMTTVVEQAGFDLAMAQYSAAVGPASDTYALPRFPVNERYGDMDRFSLISRAKALPVTDVLPQDPWLDGATNPPLFGFTVVDDSINLDRLTCYPSHMGKPAAITVMGENRVEIRFEKAVPKGRSRVNCTLPAGGGRWYWFGRPFFLPGAEE